MDKALKKLQQGMIKFINKVYVTKAWTVLSGKTALRIKSEG